MTHVATITAIPLGLSRTQQALRAAFDLAFLEDWQLAFAELRSAAADFAARVPWAPGTLVLIEPHLVNRLLNAAEHIGDLARGAAIYGLGNPPSAGTALEQALRLAAVAYAEAVRSPDGGPSRQSAPEAQTAKRLLITSALACAGSRLYVTTIKDISN